MVESDFIDHSHDGFWNESPEELAEYGVVTDTYDPDQMFVEWLQSVTPEGKTVVYHGNQYQGTGTGRTSSPVDRIKPIALEGTEASQNTEGKPITLENSNASQNAEGINKSETKDASTLEKTETGNEVSSNKIDDADSFEWVTHLNDESDTKDKTNTKNTDTTKGEKSQYPNGMSEEEFNDYYTFAYGMTHGTPWNLDDEGERMPYYGDIELPSSLAEQAKDRLDYYTGKNEAHRKELQEEYDKYNNYAKALSDFVENYKDRYKGPDLEKETRKRQLEASKVFEEAENKYYEADDALDEARQELFKLAQEKGIDVNITAEDILASNASEFRLSKEQRSYALASSEGIVRKTTQKAFKGGDFILTVDSSAKEYGNYLVKIAPSKGGIGVSQYKVGVISPKGDMIVNGVITTPNATTNGSWNLKDANGKTIANGESTSAFTQSVSKALSNAAITDYENSKSTSPYSDDIRAVAQKVIDAEKTKNAAEADMENARKLEAEARTSSSKDEQKEIMNAYASGKINAVQAANALARAETSGELNFSIDSIMSDVPADKFKIEEPIGKVGETSVGKDTFTDDMSNPKTAESIITEFEQLNDMKDRLNEIDVSNIKSKEQAETLSNDLSNYLSDLSVKANNELQTLVTSLLKTGGQLQNVRNDPKFKSLSTEIYTLAQAVYDKTSAIEEYTGKYFGDIDISSRRAIKKNIIEISDKIAEMQGAEHIVHTDSKGRTSFVLNSEEVKALANYGKTIDATKDAAIALMKSAAFNGAENVTGDKYSEAWKREIAVTSDDRISKQTVKDSLKDIASGFFGTKDSGKFTFGDFLASSTKGMLGVVTAGLGIAAIPYNPVLGTMLTYAGVNSVGREILKFGTDIARSSTTNEEAMFGQEYDRERQVWNEIYNRSFEKANYGDPKSVATWTAAVGIIGGLVEMTAGGIGIADGIVRIKQNVEILANRGLSGNIDTTIQNIYNLGENIITWSNMNLNINDYMKDPDQALIYKGKNVNTLTDDDISIKPNYATYGTATSDDSSVLDNKYSGYTEQAKNSNLAKDYNAGMEKNVNEAVSDKYVKVFKVMLDKEPDYIRKVLIAIPKNHFEMGW